MCILPIFRKIFPRKKEYLSRNESGNRATCPEIGHPTRRTLSKITKNTKRFMVQAMKLYDYVPELDATV